MIDLHELKVLIRALGYDIKKNELKKLVDDADPNHNGSIRYEVFLDLSKDWYYC